MSPPSRPVIVLGIDAANPALLKAWADDGTLPNLHRLMARGLVGDTRSLDGFFVGATWPSFYTGVSPARHGIHYQLQLRTGSYELYEPAAEQFVKAEPFWRVASAAGRRVAVLDVPLARLDTALNGIQVVEWGAHDAYFGFQTAPPELERAIVDEFGAHPAGPSCDGNRRTADDYREFVEALEHGARTKGRLTRYFLDRGPWDLVVQVFTEGHCAGHQCWHLHDDTHPAHDLALAAVVGDPLRRVYAAIDASVGDVLVGAGDAVILVVAAHGMSYWYGAQFLLPEILFRLGVSTPLPGSQAGSRPAAVMRSAVKGVWTRLPAPVRSALMPLRERMRPPAERWPAQPAISVDVATSACFPLNNGLAVGGIRLNLEGREPAGLLRPGAEADAFVEELAADLLAIVDERTGRPLVRRVLRTTQRYDGPCLDELPDLLVEWSDDVPTGSTRVGDGAAARVRVASPKIGTVEGVNDYGRTGEHRPEGLFIAAGPGIRPGRMARTVSVLDFAPTIGALMDVPMPAGDGHAIEEITVGPA